MRNADVDCVIVVQTIVLSPVECIDDIFAEWYIGRSTTGVMLRISRKGYSWIDR